MICGSVLFFNLEKSDGKISVIGCFCENCRSFVLSFLVGWWVKLCNVVIILFW